MSRRVTYQQLTQQPQGAAFAGNSGLASHLASLYAPSVGNDAVTGAIARRDAGPITTLLQDLGRYGSGISTPSSNVYVPAPATDSSRPWTMAMVCRFDATINGASSRQIAIRTPAGAVRGIGLGFTSGTVLQGYVFDGADKTVTHQTVIAFPPPVTVITGVVSCSGGFLRVFLNGEPGSSPVAVSNTGSTVGDHILSVNDTATTGYSWPLVAYLDGVGWGEQQARDFDANPWQLFAPRRIWVPQSGGAGLPTLSLSTFKPGTLTGSGWTARVTAS